MRSIFPVCPDNSARTCSVVARDWNSSPTFGWAIETTSVGSFLLLHSVEKNSPTIPLHEGMWGLFNDGVFSPKVK